MTEPRRTDPTTMTREEMRAFNATMVDRIRSVEPQQYAEECYVLRVVHVRGRHSGQLRTFPIAVTQLGGRRYLCAPHRGRDWVRNLVAAGRCRVERDPLPDHRAVLVDGAEAAPVVAAYLRKLDRPTNQWPFRADAPLSEIRRHADQLAVFRLEPAAD